MKITLEHALTVCRQIEKTLEPHGYHVALAGSVLHRGESEKDLDVILYAHDPKHTMLSTELISILSPLGVAERFETDPDYTNRTVIIAAQQGIRVDLIILN